MWNGPELFQMNEFNTGFEMTESDNKKKNKLNYRSVLDFETTVHKRNGIATKGNAQRTKFGNV